MTDKKRKIIIALKKARTSIDQIIRTIESADEKKCFEIIQQNLAAVGLLRSANILMLEMHLDAYVDVIKSASPSEKKKLKQVRDEVIRIVQTAQNK